MYTFYKDIRHLGWSIHALFVLLNILACAIAPGGVSAQNEQIFLNHPGFEVIIEYLDEEATSAGLVREHLKNHVELQLRREKITVLDDHTSAPGMPYLHVVIHTIETDGIYTSHIMLLVNEAVRLHRNGLITVAPIWEKYLTTQSYRTGFVEEVTNSVDVLLEYLVNEYLKANQKS